MGSQEQEKIEELSRRIRNLADENVRMKRANFSLASVVAERNEALAMLESECRKAKARKK